MIEGMLGFCLFVSVFNKHLPGTCRYVGNVIVMRGLNQLKLIPRINTVYSFTCIKNVYLLYFCWKMYSMWFMSPTVKLFFIFTLYFFFLHFQLKEKYMRFRYIYILKYMYIICLITVSTWCNLSTIGNIIF